MHIRWFRQWLAGCIVLVLITMFPHELPTPVSAQTSAVGFASAVPCLDGSVNIATTCFADTIYTPVPSGDPALVRVNLSGHKQSLVPIGTTSGGIYGRISSSSGIGSVYGLAYDDGAISGVQRLFIATFTRRFTSYGSFGPGGVYEYRFDDGQLYGSFIVPDAGHDRPNHNQDDTAILPVVGASGLGDIEISPDGETLYIMNLTMKRIERYDITQLTPRRLAPVAVPLHLISSNPTFQARLQPFALEFAPGPQTDEMKLFVGVTYTAQPNGAPRAYVLVWSVKTGHWQMILDQPLVASIFNERFVGSTYMDILKKVKSNEDITGWNAWSEQFNKMIIENVSRSIFYAQPLLTDIEFSSDGQFMRLGLRDRIGDLTFFGPPPAGHYTSIAQGDTLNYQFANGRWNLLLDQSKRKDRVSTSDEQLRVMANQADWVNDHLHSFPGERPAHVENHMGSLLKIPRTDGRELIVTTALLGNNSAGLMVYQASQVDPTSMITLIPSGTNKLSSLGDLELLCTYAFVKGQLWFDHNGNGVREGHDATLGGIRLEVVDPATSAVMGYAQTASDGSYIFAVPPNRSLFLRVAPGQFQVGQPLAGMLYTLANVGNDDSRDSDAHPAFGAVEFADRQSGNGITGIALRAPLREELVRQVDIGLTRQMRPATIGDRVWLDLNRNGIQERGEPGMAGVALRLDRLPGAAPAITTYPRTVVTDFQGNYTFDNLEPGQYRLFVTLPAGHNFTTPGRGEDRQYDSDVDPATGLSPVMVVTSGDVRPDLDVGLVANQMDLSLHLAGPTEAIIGDELHYIINVRHTGMREATNVELRMTMPTGASFLSATIPARLNDSTLIWQFPQLGINSAQTIEVRLRAPTTIGNLVAQLVTASAHISANPPDNNLTDNSASVITRLLRAELSVDKDAPAVVLSGDDLIYTLRVTNRGSAPAANVIITDPLPPQVDFVSLLLVPAGACRYEGAQHALRCAVDRLLPNQTIVISFQTRPRLTAADRLDNQATVTTTTAGDASTDNTARTSTAHVSPDLAVTLAFTPTPVPAGEATKLVVGYRNHGNGIARATAVTVNVPESAMLTSWPPMCQHSDNRLLCALGDLAPATSGELRIGLHLPVAIAVDQLAASATITSATPERTVLRADNDVSITVAVVRPNLFVQLRAPASIVGQGSVFAYTIDYGNLYRRRPLHTRAAADTVLEFELPADVQFVGSSRTPTIQSGRRLYWEMGVIDPQTAGSIEVVVQTNVPAGIVLPATARIATGTPADDLIDNIATLNINVVPPPSTIGAAAGDLRMAIRSTLDPATRDAIQTNGVYLSDGPHIAWPVGEVLDVTPQLVTLTFADEPLPWPYAYRVQVVGWSLTAIEVGGQHFDPRATDSRGTAGCRPGARPRLTPQLLTGCIYPYLGGQNRDQLGALILRERDLDDQVHLYWSRPPAPKMRPDVYLYTADGLEQVRLTIQVELEVQIVNQAPGSIGGVPLPPVPVAPLPHPARQLITDQFTINLLAPRSLIAPGN